LPEDLKRFSKPLISAAQPPLHCAQLNGQGDYFEDSSLQPRSGTALAMR
jgi:hypothetical protein